MREQLKREAIRGVGWALLSSVSVRVLQVITILTLAKILMPADFGVFALAFLIIQAMVVFRDVGFAQVLVYRQDDIRRSADTAFVLALVSSGVLAALLFVSAPGLGRLFGASEIVSPTRAMSAALLISGAANVPLALLDKRLRFKRRAIPEVTGALTYAVVSIGLATAGFRVWSLVAGWIAMTVVNTAAAWLVCTWRPSLEFDWGEARVILSYGKHLMIASLAVFAFFQIDKALVGKWLGVTALGFYSMAFTVCNLPATNLAHVVNRVMFPTYSQLQDDLPAMRSVYLRTVRYISMAAFPAAVGIFVVADPIIRVLYGQKWVPAIPLFHILALYGLTRSIGSTASAVFMSTGNPGLVKRVSMLQLFVAVPLVYPAAMRFGTVGVAVLFAGAYALGTIYALGKVQRILGIRAVNYVSAAGLSLGATALAGASGWIVSVNFYPPSWAGVAAVCIMFCSVYGASIFFLDRSTYGELVGLLAKLKQEREGSEKHKDDKYTYA